MASSSSTHSTSNVENLPPHLIRLITKQMMQLYKQPPAEGVLVHLNHDDVSDVQFIIIGPEHTPYSGGHFRIKLVLPPDYPAQPPRGYFLTKIFHPNVATANGEICVNALKRGVDAAASNSTARDRERGGQSDGNGSSGSLGHVMVVIKCLMINPNPESALNEEAGKLLLDDYEEFSKRARLMTQIHARAPSAGTGTTTTTTTAMMNKDEQTQQSSLQHQGQDESASSSNGGSMKRQLAESNNSSSASELPSASSSTAASGQNVLNKKKKLKRL